MKNRVISNLNDLIKKQVFLVFFTLCITSFYPAFSQNAATFVPKINNIPTSPEAALLGRFGDIPVGYYTGTADISIPIYTIKESGVEIPIQLRYHSSGIKVADEATWVGLGWDLSPGGEIIQEVRGKRDDEETAINRLSNQVGYSDFINRFYTLQTGTYNFRYQAGFAFNNCCDALDSGLISDSNEIVMKLLENYGQPDIYNYNFSGYSGKFYINPENQQIILIDKKEDITFEKINTTSWVATTLDGNKFHFGIVETAGGYVANDYSGVTFKLDYITFINGKTINFSYVDAKYTETRRIENKDLFVLTGFGQNQTDPFSNPMTWQNKKTLSKITTNEAIIDFNLEDREDFFSDINSPVKRLKSIDITSTITNQKINSFEFGYSYFPYNLLGALYNGGILDSYTALHETTLGKRLKLDSIKEIGYDSNGVAITTKPAHQFEYNMTATMPLKNSFAIDFWGYYNGENNDKLLPNLDYFDYTYDIRYKNLNSLFVYGYVGANRYTNNTYAGSYMLKKITYPTGGLSEFEYEPNSFTNQFIPDKVKLDMAYKLNLLQDKNYSGDLTSKTFTLSRATTITFDNTIYGGYIYNMATGYNYAQMTGSYIELLKVNMTGGSPVVTSIKKWDLSSVLNVDFTANNGKQWIEEVRVEYDSNPNIYYTVNVSLPNNLVNNSYGSVNVKTRFYYYDETGVDTSISNQCGMRVKSIKNYTQTGTLTSNKVIRYFEGKLLNKFEPLSVSKAQANTCEISNLAGAIFIDDYVSYFNRITLSTDDFGVDGGNPVGYGRVEEVELDANNNDKGKNVYSYINEINQTKKGLPNIINAKNGMINNESTYDKIGNKLRETNYLYSSISLTNISFGIKINNQSFGTTESCNIIPDIKTEYIPYETGINHKYSFSTYPIISEWNMLTKKITNHYFNGNAITSTEDYTYNNLGKTSTVTTANSNNEQLITKLYYSNDAIAYNLAMSAAKMTGIPIYTEQYKGNELLSTQKTEYTKDDADKATTNNLILPKRVFASKGINTHEKRVTYDQYDNKGNLLQYTLENGTPVAIIWGYNQTLPVAKIENATYSQATAVYTTNDTSFRNSLPNAMITTYTYKPLIGVSTITDAKGDKITYSYDAFGRLLNVKDKDGNILSENEYHYKN
jgi:YD repeat-containing protein